MTIIRDQDRVLKPELALCFPEGIHPIQRDERLDTHDHVGLKRLVVVHGQPRSLVDVEPYPMPDRLPATPVAPVDEVSASMFSIDFESRFDHVTR